jgi:flagellar FliL protein
LTIIMSKTAPASGEAAAPTKSKKKLIIIVLAVLLLAGGGVGGYLVMGSGGSKHTAKPKPKPGKVVVLDPITVNLAGGHYLKIHLALQGTTEATDDLDGSHALDLAVAQFSNVQMAELASTDGRTKAKDKLLKAVEDAYEGKIMDIYFTEFVMQ